jgi:ketosteroid isomerase-like protein
MRRGVLVAILTASGLVDGCGVAVNLDKSAAPAELRKQDEQWSAAAARNDLEATLSFYADDAVVLPGNAPIAADKMAIRELWAGMLGPGTAVSWKVTKVEVAKSGELGYLYGTYELTMKDPKGGSPVQDKGKLVEIWKKQADGKWKCIVDTYNSDLAPPSAVGGASK